MRHEDIWEPSAMVEARNDDIVAQMCRSEGERGRTASGDTVQGQNQEDWVVLHFRVLIMSKTHKYVTCSQ